MRKKIGIILEIEKRGVFFRIRKIIRRKKEIFVLEVKEKYSSKWKFVEEKEDLKMLKAIMKTQKEFNTKVYVKQRKKSDLNVIYIKK